MAVIASINDAYDGRLGILLKFWGANLEYEVSETLGKALECLLWVRSSKDDVPFADLAIDYRSLTFTRFYV